MMRSIWKRQTIDDDSAPAITVHHNICQGQTTAISSNGGRLHLLSLLTIACLATLSPPSVSAAPQSNIQERINVGVRHPPMMHSVGYLMAINAGKDVIRRGLPSAGNVLVWPPAASSVDENAIDEAADNEADAFGADEDEIRGNPSSSAVVLPRPAERRMLLPHLMGPKSSGGIRKTVTTNGIEDEKRWAPTEIRMNEFIHKIQAVNAASRYNRRLSEPASNDYEWWARRVRRQRQQQSDGSKAAQAVKLYGLRTRMGLEE